MQRFLDATGSMSPAERGAYLEHPPPGAPDLDEAHHVSAPDACSQDCPLAARDLMQQASSQDGLWMHMAVHAAVLEDCMQLVDAIQWSVHAAQCLSCASAWCAAQTAALTGNTAPPDLDEEVKLHFVALVEQQGRCALALSPCCSWLLEKSSYCALPITLAS